MSTHIDHTPISGVESPEPRVSPGYLLIADDGPVGPVDFPLEPPEGGDADYLVVRAPRLLRSRRPVVPTRLVRTVDHRRHLVYVRGTTDQIRHLPEHVPLAI